MHSSKRFQRKFFQAFVIVTFLIDVIISPAFFIFASSSFIVSWQNYVSMSIRDIKQKTFSFTISLKTTIVYLFVIFKLFVGKVNKRNN